MIIDLEALFCLVDNVIKKFDKVTINDKFLQAIFPLSEKSVGRKSKLNTSENVTIAILMHLYKVSNVKSFYKLIKAFPSLKNAFSEMPSYEQFNRGINKCTPYIVLVINIIMQLNRSNDSEFYIIDSTKLPVCKFEHSDKVKIDEHYATAGKTIDGWFFGFKLHFIINHDMEPIQFRITTGSTNDRAIIDENLLQNLEGYLVGDKGYIGQKLKEYLAKLDINLLTYHKKNMKPQNLTRHEKKLLRKRKYIETTFFVLKYCYHLINQRAKSVAGFIRHAISALAAYSIDIIFKKMSLDQIYNLFDISKSKSSLAY